MFVPEALTACRESRGVSKSKLALKPQVSVAYISYLESGDRLNPSPDVIEKMAQTLDVDPAAFYVKPEWIRDWVRRNRGLVVQWLDGVEIGEEDAAA